MTPNTDMTPLDFCLKWKLPPETRVDLEKIAADARIDELKKLRIHHEIHSMDKAYHDQEIQFIDDRIAELKRKEHNSDIPPEYEHGLENPLELL